MSEYKDPAYITVENYLKKTASDSNMATSSYANAQANKSTTEYDKEAKKIVKETDTKIQNLSKKGATDTPEIRASIAASGEQKLNDLKDKKAKSLTEDLTDYSVSMIKNLYIKIKGYVDSILQKFKNLGAAVVASIKALVADYINAITSAIGAIINGVIAAVWLVFENIFKASMAVINAIVNIYNKIVAIPTINTDISKFLKFDFYKRLPGQSTVSNYTQAIKKNADGSNKPNPSAILATPSTVISLPKIKIPEINVSVAYKPNPVAKAMNKPASLIPTISNKTIAEPLSTDDKAEYGKVTVKENKGGFVEISDETPGNVRKVVMHPSGTKTEMLDNGDHNVKVTGNKLDTHDGEWNITTTKDKVEIISGDNKIEIRKGYTQSITNDYNSKVGGNSQSVVEGDVIDDFKGAKSVKIAVDYLDNIGGNREENTSGDVVEKTMGSHKETVTGDLTIHVIGNINITCGGNANITSTGNTSITAGALVEVKAPFIKLN